MQRLQNNDDDLAEIQAAYGASCTKYEVLTEAWNRKGDTVIISGHGCALKVKNDALVIFPGRTHKDQRQENTVLYRGVHNVKQIILLSDKGLITLDAVRWAIEQNIPVIMVDGHGNLMQSLLLITSLMPHFGDFNIMLLIAVWILLLHVKLSTGRLYLR